MFTSISTILGFTVERIAGGKVEQLEGGKAGYLWNNYFSYCPFLGITKSLFFNKFILQKGVYIGSGGKWFFWCVFVGGGGTWRGLGSEPKITCGP